MIEFGYQISAEVNKSNHDPAAAAAHDAQAPDPPARPLVEKNVMSKGREVLPPERPEGRRGLSDLKDTSAEMLKIDDAPAAPDDQDPDAPERPVVTSLATPVDSSYSFSSLALSSVDSFSSSSIPESSAPATLLSAAVDNVNCNSATSVQSVGNLLNVDIIGGHRRHFCSAAVDGHGGRGRRARVESARGRRRASESAASERERARARWR